MNDRVSDKEYYKLKNCVCCGSGDLDIDSTAASEIYGVCYQSGWVLCNDCEHGICVDFDDSGNNIIDWFDMVTIWNAGVIYDGVVTCEK